MTNKRQTWTCGRCGRQSSDYKVVIDCYISHGDIPANHRADLALARAGLFIYNMTEADWEAWLSTKKN